MGLMATGLVKEFAGVRALDDVDITLRDGEVHALLGANGSGKSTLAKTLTGVYQPEQGSITVGAKRIAAIASPHQANQFGIAIVHQEAPLVDTMTVAESVALFRGYPTRNGRILWDRLHAQTEAMFLAYDLHIDPRSLARKLSPAERALVAMVVALDQVKAGLELLVLDEVTASLPENQAELFLDRVRSIARSGTAVLMVTHRLGELRGRANRVTVLRGGRVALSAEAQGVDYSALTGAMRGPTEIAANGTGEKTGVVSRLWAAAGVRPKKETGVANQSNVVMEACGLSGRFLRDVSFALQRGEIVGVAGLVEGGIGELPQILGGTSVRAGGALRVNGRELPLHMTPRQAIDAGLTLLPVD